LSILLLVLKRSVEIPKAVWRLPATRRTLDSFSLAPLLRQLPIHTIPLQPTLLTAELTPEATEITHQQTRPLKPIDHTGVFRLTQAQNTVKVALYAEACRLRLHLPHRPSRHLANLEPNQPRRVLLNGRADWSSGRYYYLRDDHLILFHGPQPTELPPATTIDLQADLW
jgi:hypothetical protein